MTTHIDPVTLAQALIAAPSVTPATGAVFDVLEAALVPLGFTVERCIDGIEPDVDRMRRYAESSPSIVTPLNSAIGYEEAAAVAKQALKEHKTIRQTVIDRGLIGDKLSEAELDKRLDVLAMAKVQDV